ncbi:MAG: hypothetical protein JWL61_274 [Gemmatimonadetes bacterium]|nr:hypothetical protein [Gemmatimonadota bacterium]
MKNLLTAFAALAMLASSASAQKAVQTGKGGGGSPHMKGEWTTNGANISIEYGSPYLKGRPEATLMPHGTEWRTGADQATVITSNKPLTFGTVTLAPGSYTINTLPGDKEWKLILGKLGKAGQWGVPYQPALEISRAPMKLGKTKAPVEQVTYSIDPSPTGGTLRIEWGTASVTSPFTVGK